ncbi:hypothetical protein ACLQ9N_02860 [Gallibacterium anatis]|uniref:hypothetical protein n=1 Tax=Gallibacterium anatis TaxID=750 RepID=UPI0039FD5923
MVLFYIVIDFSPTSTTTNARFACALYLRPEGQSFTAHNLIKKAHQAGSLMG